jgi:hypothetical protein
VSILDDMDELVAARFRALIVVGRVSYASSFEWEVDQRRTLGIHKSGVAFELLVWERGDAEIVCGTPEDPLDEYHPAVASADLPVLLDRLIAIASD